MNKLKVEYVNKEELKAYVNNAKKHSPEQVESIKKSIMKFGIKKTKPTMYLMEVNADEDSD